LQGELAVFVGVVVSKGKENEGEKRFTKFSRGKRDSEMKGKSISNRCEMRRRSRRKSYHRKGSNVKESENEGGKFAGARHVGDLARVMKKKTLEDIPKERDLGEEKTYKGNRQS